MIRVGEAMLQAMRLADAPNAMRQGLVILRMGGELHAVDTD
jgi:hypothetical protein